MGTAPVWRGMVFPATGQRLPSYAAGYPETPAGCDSITRLIDAQPQAGATIIAADLLRHRLAYPIHSNK